MLLNKPKSGARRLRKVTQRNTYASGANISLEQLLKYLRDNPSPHTINSIEQLNAIRTLTIHLYEGHIATHGICVYKAMQLNEQLTIHSIPRLTDISISTISNARYKSYQIKDITKIIVA